MCAHVIVIKYIYIYKLNNLNKISQTPFYILIIKTATKPVRLDFSGIYII